jgi:uncharacterized protein
MNWGTEVSTYSQYTDKELNEMINEAVQNEDYEKASIIRDELKKRRQKITVRCQQSR